MTEVRSLLLLLVVWMLVLGGIVLVGSELLRHLEPPPPSLLIAADYQRCVKVPTPPLNPPRRPVLNSHASEIV